MPGTRLQLFTIAVAGGALFLGTAAPAAAESKRIRDGGDTKGALDIRKMRASHTKKKVVVRVTARNLKPRKKQAFAIGYDNHARKPYYTYLARVRLARKPRVKLFKLQRNNPVRVVKCKRAKLKVKYKRDVMRYAVPRKCLKRPKKVQINVLALKRKRIKDQVPDYGFTKPLSRG